MVSNEFSDYAHKRVLIKGEAGSGKTLLMHKILLQAVESLPKGSVALIDMAPERKVFGGRKIGGAINVEDLVSKLNYMRPEKLRAPRLEGKTSDKVSQLAKENAEKIDVFLDRFIDAPSDVLFMNDLTIYLHAGSFKKIRRVIEKVDTFIGNAYEGVLLAEDFGSGISENERRLLNKLEKSMDVIISI